MHIRSNTLIAVLLLVATGAACSMLRPKRPLTWHVTLEVESPGPDRTALIGQTVAVIEKRLDAFGVSNFKVQPHGSRIVVELPEVGDRERVKQLIATWGKLELAHVVSPPSPAPPQTYSSKEEALASLNSGSTLPANRWILPYFERAELTSAQATKWVVVESPPIITGNDLRNAQAVNGRGGEDDYQINFTLTKTGADRFGAWTGANINEYLGIILNDEVKSMAYIKSQIYDQGQITGRFTKQSAEDLALVLKAGALPARVKIIEESANK